MAEGVGLADADADAAGVGAGCAVLLSRPRERAFASRLLVVLGGRADWEDDDALFG